MKKLLSVLLCLSFILACAAAFAETAFDYTGSWSLIAVEQDGQIKSGNESGSADMTLVIESDGTCTWYSVMKNKEKTGTWQSVDGGIATIDITGSDAFLSLDENERLVLDTGSKRIILQRSSSYCGTWALRFGINGGRIFSVSEMDTDLTIVLQEGGACFMRSKGRTLAGTWTEEDGGVTLNAMGKPVFFALEKGVLSSEENGFRLCLTRDISVCANVPAEAFTGKWELFDAYIYDTAFTEVALEEGLTFQLDDDGVVKRESKTKPDASNYLTWTMEEVEGLGTVATIREHSGGDYLDYEVYLLETGYIKLWNSEGRYQLYRRIAE